MNKYHDNYIDVYPDTHWHRRYPNDTEVAAIPLPGHGCCDSGHDDECVCVTETDVELWNQVSSISSLSGIDWDALSSVSSLNTSADAWNRNFNTVHQNSAIWGLIGTYSGIEDLSGYWQSASNTVSTHSGRWEDAYTAVSEIPDIVSSISSLSSIVNSQIKLYFDKTLSGDGKQNTPYGVIYYKQYTELVNSLNSDVSNLYKDDINTSSKVQNWISLDSTSDVNGINPYIKSLFSAVAVKDNDQDKTLIKHGDLIEWLIKNGARKGDWPGYGGGVGIDVDSATFLISIKPDVMTQIEHGESAYQNTKQYVAIDRPITKSDISAYTAENTFYYCGV